MLTTRYPADVVEAYAPRDRLKGRLSREHYEVLKLDAEKLKYREISAIIGHPLGTVRSRLHRAKAVLAALITKGEREIAYGEDLQSMHAGRE